MHTHDPAALASRPGLGHLQEDHGVPVDRGSVDYLISLHRDLHQATLPPDPQPARPILTPFDLEAIIDALGTLTGVYFERGQPWQSTARLQRRLINAQPYLVQALAGLAPAATMTEER